MIVSGDECFWWWLFLVMIVSGDDCFWWWLYLVMIVSGDECLIYDIQCLQVENQKEEGCCT